ncbi:hypothetical protein [Micromonospora sp. URMC 103]|uniref:hypothetical protein n=1 Tax=Micromonospora sp. URMC 103 TaxID=3423406 RepID=UPI003F1AF637
MAFARLGYRVKEMLGGYEYWVREGLPVVTEAGIVRRPADDLTAPRVELMPPVEVPSRVELPSGVELPSRVGSAGPRAAVVCDC